jgi:hypothetical protein
MVPPWLKPPTTVRSGGMPSLLGRSLNGLGDELAAGGLLRFVDTRAPPGSREKSNHANEPGPMRCGARRLST